MAISATNACLSSLTRIVMFLYAVTSALLTLIYPVLTRVHHVCLQRLPTQKLTDKAQFKPKAPLSVVPVPLPSPHRNKSICGTQPVSHAETSLHKRQSSTQGDMLGIAISGGGAEQDNASSRIDPFSLVRGAKSIIGRHRTK